MPWASINYRWSQCSGLFVYLSITKIGKLSVLSSAKFPNPVLFFFKYFLRWTSSLSWVKCVFVWMCNCSYSPGQSVIWIENKWPGIWVGYWIDLGTYRNRISVMSNVWKGPEMVRRPVSTTQRPPVEKLNQLQLCEGNDISWARLHEISATRKNSTCWWRAVYTKELIVG